jgi:proline dehydrogenase
VAVAVEVADAASVDAAGAIAAIRQAVVEEHGVDPDGYEFQMLLGVRESRGDRLVADGHRVRVYVPFGSRWYEYSLRRLQENPRIAGYVAGDVVSRLLRADGRGR